MLSGSVKSFGEIAIIKLRGYVDQCTATELEKIVDDLIAKASFQIIADLRCVDYMSSAGWGIFLAGIKVIRENEGDLKLVGLQPNVREVFELLEFNHILREFFDVKDALQDFSSKIMNRAKPTRSVQY
jgi:anti-sigma B factor antagonist